MTLIKKLELVGIFAGCLFSSLALAEKTITTKVTNYIQSKTITAWCKGYVGGSNCGTASNGESIEITRSKYNDTYGKAMMIILTMGKNNKMITKKAFTIRDTKEVNVHLTKDISTKENTMPCPNSKSGEWPSYSSTDGKIQVCIIYQ